MTVGCSASFRVANEPRSTSGPIVEFQPSLTDYIRLRRIFLSVQAFGGTSVLVLGIGTPAIVGTSRSTATVLLHEEVENNYLPGLQIFNDWTTFPTIPTTFFRRITQQLTSSSGNLISVDFSAGLGVAAGGSLVLWTISQSVSITLLYDINVEFDI